MKWKDVRAREKEGESTIAVVIDGVAHLLATAINNPVMAIKGEIDPGVMSNG